MADKAIKFQEIAERRTNKVLNDLRLLGQCSNPRLYLFTDDQVRKIFKEIDKELRIVKQSFAPKNHSNDKFKL